MAQDIPIRTLLMVAALCLFFLLNTQNLRLMTTPSDGAFVAKNISCALASTVERPEVMQNEKFCVLQSNDLVHTSVYQHQIRNHDPALDCAKQKYLVIEPMTMGFGAMIFSVAAYYGAAVNGNRMPVLNWHWDLGGFMAGVSNSSICPNQQASSAWECYFEPFSSPCGADDALRLGNVTSSLDLPIANVETAPAVRGGSYRPFNYRAIPKKAMEFPPVHLITDTVEPTFWHSDPLESQIIRYLTRFNPQTKTLLEPALRASVAELREAKAKHSESVSLLIRGSDKCNEDITGREMAHETDCLPLKAYMDALLSIWEWDHRVKNVLVTSDDERYIQAVKRFAAEPPPPGFESTTTAEDGGTRTTKEHKFRFFFNDQDVQQGSSVIAQAIKAGKIHEHFEVVRSMWTTIEFALQSRYLIINCGSFFHKFVMSYRHSTCRDDMGPPMVFCLDHKPSTGVAGFTKEQIRQGGDYPGRWTYNN